ncbi:hypothetical protein HZS_3545, partial [Henneguya salminicola]
MQKIHKDELIRIEPGMYLWKTGDMAQAINKILCKIYIMLTYVEVFYAFLKKNRKTFGVPHIILLLLGKFMHIFITVIFLVYDSDHFKKLSEIHLFQLYAADALMRFIFRKVTFISILRLYIVELASLSLLTCLI